MTLFKPFFRRLFAFLYLSVIKVLNITSFSFHPLQIVSLSTKFVFNSRGKIILGKKIGTRRHVEFRASDGGQIIVGDNSFFNNGCLLNSMDKICIGFNTQIGPNVLIFDHDHDFRVEGGIRVGDFTKSPIIIGNNVWIGAGCIILKGTIIGDNCVVAAGSVVKGNYPPNKIILQKRQTLTNELK